MASINNTAIPTTTEQPEMATVRTSAAPSTAGGGGGPSVLPHKKRKTMTTDTVGGGPVKSTNREHRLAQNRKAARESRKRKKGMIEELQRSLVYFSKANASLRNEHHELTRLMLSANAALRKEVPDAAAAVPEAAPVPTTTLAQAGLASMRPGASMAGKLL